MKKAIFASLIALAFASCKKEGGNSANVTCRIDIDNVANYGANDELIVHLKQHPSGTVIQERTIRNHETADFGVVNPGEYFVKAYDQTAPLGGEISSPQIYQVVEGEGLQITIQY
ncbi:MAG: hypothetical protein JST49_03540 [Bacteroidetes bacterium]|nr:hypothetical protein [Bacteroidota bacterium]